MSRDLPEKLEQARRAVESAYADPHAARDAAVSSEEMQDAGRPRAEQPDTPAPGAGPLSRARGLARGAPASAGVATPWWRRPFKRLMARLIRFETAWQHEFNLATADAVGELVQELARASGRLEQAAGRVSDLHDSRATLETRLGQQESSRRELEAALEDARQAAGALGERIQAESDRAAAARDALEQSIQRNAETATRQESAVRKDLNRFRNQLGEVLRAGENLRRGLLDSAQRLTQLEKESLSAARLEERLAPLARELAGINLSLDEVRQAGAEAAARQRQELEQLQQNQERLQQNQERLQQDQAGAVETSARSHAEMRQDLAGLAARMSAAAGRLEEMGAQLRMQEPDLDALEFARRFRGSETEIRRRLEPYVSLLAGIPAVRQGPVLEVGSGRGEFLRLCREAGLPALGLEPDRALATHGQEAGLDVRAERALPYLAGQADGSLGAIFSAQVIEHLPPGVLSALIREAFRVLRPGGLIVLETLNPACLSVLATTFYRDPSHRAPVHPDTALFLLESAGFIDVQVVTHTPVPDDQRLTPAAPPSREPAGLAAVREHLNRELERLNHLLFSDQEYHVRGIRP